MNFLQTLNSGQNVLDFSSILRLKFKALTNNLFELSTNALFENNRVVFHSIDEFLFVVTLPRRSSVKHFIHDHPESEYVWLITVMIVL